jgi:hypothetical protein
LACGVGTIDHRLKKCPPKPVPLRFGSYANDHDIPVSGRNSFPVVWLTCRQGGEKSFRRLFTDFAA